MASTLAALSLWDFGQFQAVVHPLSGEVRIIYGGPGSLSGGPFSLVNGTLVPSDEAAAGFSGCDPASLLDWRVEEATDDGASSLTLKRKDSEEALSLAEMADVMDGKVWSLDCGGQKFETEVYWFAAPVVLDEEPVSVWLPMSPLASFVFGADTSQRHIRSFSTWRDIIVSVGLSAKHIQPSKRSQLQDRKRSRSQPSDALFFSSETDFKVSLPGVFVLLSHWAASKRYKAKVVEGKNMAGSLLSAMSEHFCNLVGTIDATIDCFAVGVEGGAGGLLAIPVATDTTVLREVLLDAQKHVHHKSRLPWWWLVARWSCMQDIHFDSDCIDL